MHIPKQNKKTILKYVFKEGVCVAKKDFQLPKHPEIRDVTNLQVIKVLTSLTSRGYCKEQFAWRHYYWFLTDEGVEYLREYLHLPADVVPMTHMKTERTAPVPNRRPARRPQGDRPADEYRRAEKKSAPLPEGEAKPEFSQ